MANLSTLSIGHQMVFPDNISQSQANEKIGEALVKNERYPPQIAPAGATPATRCLKQSIMDKDSVEKQTPVWHSFTNFAREEKQLLQKQMQQNFGLTEAQFNEMVEALQNGDKTMFEWVFLSHFSHCRDYLVKNYRANADDAYDVTMDTLLRFHRLLIEKKIQYGNLRYLFTKMAGQIYLKSLNKRKHVSLESTELPKAVDLDDTSDRELEHQLYKAWGKLGDGCKQMLKAFYFEEKALNILALEMGKDHAAVRKQKQRCVDSLRLLFVRFF